MIMIALTILAFAVILFMMSRMMAAQDTGVTDLDNAIYGGGGDPDILLMTAYEAMTPGDSVAWTGTARVYKCTAALKDYAGTADLNKDNDSGGAGGNDVTTDFVDGDVVPVITGHVVVMKIADTNGVTQGKVCKNGTGDGVEVEDIGASTAERGIGRAQKTAATTVPFPMMQWGS